jgi:hypothetical protein
MFFVCRLAALLPQRFCIEIPLASSTSRIISTLKAGMAKTLSMITPG